ncbi:MAG TPA: hypothetical protein VMS94_04825 [Acidobacteriota bacterium]|nr:hypothetical protein [Acidobacteriota bacterium]
MSLEPIFPRVNFKSRKEFMDFLEDMMAASVEEEAEAEVIEETRGRPREMKTYIMESNNGLPKIRTATSLIAFQSPTDLPEISVLKLEYEGKSAVFYIDASDPRFLVLYTNDLADITDPLYTRLVNSTSNYFDKIWLPTKMLDKISQLTGNAFRGFGLMFDDLFAQQEPEEQPIHELRMNVSGASSAEALEALSDKKDLRRSLSRSMVRVRRGNKTTFVADELRFTGRFITKTGTSSEDHVSLVETTRKLYRNLIEEVERSSIGAKRVEERTLIEGQAFDLVLEREIEDIGLFAAKLLTPDAPFRLWGLRNKVSQEMSQIIAVDLHTGDPIDLEITTSLIRIYLPKGACGNTVLRLYTNLQHSFDSTIRFNDEKLLAIDS